MDWNVWGPAILSSALGSAVCGILLKAIIEKSVAHGFDRKLEGLKSEIRAKETQINDLKAGALAGASARHVELDKRRVAAAASLWAATVREKRFRVAVDTVASLNLPVIAAEAESNPEFSQKMTLLAEAMYRLSGVEGIEALKPPIENERIFLSQTAWTCFEALRSVNIAAVATIVTLKSGAPLSLLKDHSGLNVKLKAALPHHTSYLEKNPEAGYFLIDELELRILTELAGSLDEGEAHLKAVDTASNIILRAHERRETAFPPGFPEKLKRSPPRVDET